MARRIRRIDLAARRGLFQRSAFTLAEALVASVVLVVAVTGASTAIISSQQETSVQQQGTVSVALARQLMEEIASRPLLLPDGTAVWPTVTNRSSYDTINDYNGYTDVISAPIYHTNSASTTANFSSALPSVTVATGGASSVSLSANQYVRTVSVSYPTSIFGKTVTAGDFAIISVTVHGLNDAGVTLSRVMGKVSITR